MDLIFLHGTAAAGKLTTARALEAVVGYPVFRNHLVVDALTSVFHSEANRSCGCEKSSGCRCSPTQIQRWRASGRLEPRAAVHGDLNARNQLYRDGVLVGIIDTDDCRVEPLIWEVAAYSDPSVSPEAAWELYRQAGGPLHPADPEMLLPFARLGTLSELQWITDDIGAATHLALKTLEAIADDLWGSPTRG